MSVNLRMCQAAMEYGGIAEVPGGRSNPIIVRWLRLVIPNLRGGDEVAWCSAFMAAVAERAGADLGRAYPTALARSWGLAGVPVLGLGEILPGDVVVLSRGTVRWQGHVGLYCRHGERTVTLLGGNQGNRVGFKDYAKSRIVSIRRLQERRPDA